MQTSHSTNLKKSSNMNLYPKIKIFGPSLRERDARVALTDLLNGMDLCEERGRHNLDLSGKNDIEGAVQQTE
jgi:hypothetical protein